MVHYVFFLLNVKYNKVHQSQTAMKSSIVRKHRHNRPSR